MNSITVKRLMNQELAVSSFLLLNSCSSEYGVPPRSVEDEQKERLLATGMKRAETLKMRGVTVRSVHDKTLPIIDIGDTPVLGYAADGGFVHR